MLHSSTLRQPLGRPLRNGLRLSALVAAAVALAACASNPLGGKAKLHASATVTAATGVPQHNPQAPVAGTIHFTQKGNVVRASGTITGLKPNAPHGFHVHEHGLCDQPDFNSAGGHFNPTGAPHGEHGHGHHHVGDMPQLQADANGTAQVSFTSESLQLTGDNSIVGKAIIIHRDPDDPTAQPTGNSGPRIGCALIEAK